MSRKTGRDPVSGRQMLAGITAITSKRTGDVTYQARWSWTSPLGERLFGAKVFKDLPAAETHLLSVQLDIRRGEYLPAGRTTLADYAERWLTRKAHTWASSTTVARRQSWHRYVAPAIGRLALTAIGRAHCQRLVDDLAERGLRPSSVRFHLFTLSGILEAAVSDGLIARNPARKLIVPAVRQVEPDLWTAELARHFLAATRDSPHHTLWVFLMTTGCRVGEALALSWSDIDLGRGAVRIQATVRTDIDGSETVVRDTKTGRARTVPLTSYTVACLRAHHQRQRAPGAVIDIRDYVFTHWRGRRYVRSTIRIALNRDVARAGLPKLDPRIRNPFRHLAATLMMEQGVPPSVVQGILGHRTPAMTLQRYTHVTQTVTRDAMDALALTLSDEVNATTSMSIPGDSGGSV